MEIHKPKPVHSWREFLKKGAITMVSAQIASITSLVIGLGTFGVLPSLSREATVVPRAITVPQAPAGCAALTAKSIAASMIGEPTNGAVIISATYKAAIADRVGVPQAPVPGGPAAGSEVLIQGTPDYCQVLIDIKPVDPTAPVIKAQVNLPTNWNGRSLQFGGGGYNGTLVTGVQSSRSAGPQTPFPLTQGYITAGTDSGHQAEPGDGLFRFALNSEALTNFAYASYKKTHDVVRELSQLYYGRLPARSYYMGASEGGREAMTMAQRYPKDYDGIVAIDPVMNWTGLQAFGNNVAGILPSKPNAWLINKWQLVHDTVSSACDAMDGIADGVVSNYKNCKPAADSALATKRCASGGDEGSSCFSDAQLAVIRAAKDGYKFNFPLANGITAYAGHGYGGEGLPGNGSRWVVGTVNPAGGATQNGNSRAYTYGNGGVRYFFAQNPSFDPLTYSPDNFKNRVLEISAIMDATNPNLSAFFARGGKLILRENMSDSAQSPWTGLNYWDAVAAKMGKRTVDKFFVAYVATGLPHTSLGVDAGSANAPPYGIPGRVDLLEPLVKWVEKGEAPPTQFTLTNQEALPPHKVIASKPMCRYGTYPKFVGSSPAGGSDAKNYSCVAN